MITKACGFALLAVVHLLAGTLGAQEPSGSTLQELRGARATISFSPGDSLRAARFLELLEAQPPLPALPDSLPLAVRVVLASTQAVFDSVIGGSVPEWTGGVAIPARSMLVIPGYQSSLTRPGEAVRVLRHEWAHLALHQRMGGLRIPRWFDEGYAEWAGGWDASETWRLRIALAFGGTPSLDSLSFRWPSGATQARSAYLLSATVIEYLVSESEVHGLEVFLTRWLELESFEEALRATYGVTSSGLEEDWRDYVKRRYGWLFVLSHAMVFWGFLSIVLLGMVQIRRKEKRRRMAILREQELPDTPAYWMEEQDHDAQPPVG